MKGTTVWGWDLLGLIWRTRRKRRAKRVVKPQAVVHTSGMPDVAAAKLNEINGPCVTLQQREMLVRKMDATVPIKSLPVGAKAADCERVPSGAALLWVAEGGLHVAHSIVLKGRVPSKMRAVMREQ